MKNKTEIKAKKVTAFLNHVKKENTSEFSFDYFIEMLKLGKCSYAKKVAKGLLTEGLIVASETNPASYQFTNETPIHYGVIEKYLGQSSKKAIQYTKKCNLNKFLPANEEEIEGLIEFLKEKGYKIMKPIIEYKEC